MKTTERLRMAKAALGGSQAAVQVAHDRQCQRQVAEPCRFLILNVEHLLAPMPYLILVIDQNRFFQVLTSGDQLAFEEQCATEQQMPHDERRLRLLLGRAGKALLRNSLAFSEAGTRDLVRAETGEHGKYLGRVAELAA